METHDWKGRLFCCLSFYVSRRRTTSQFCPPPSHHSQISPCLPPSSPTLPPSSLSILFLSTSPSSHSTARPRGSRRPFVAGVPASLRPRSRKRLPGLVAGVEPAASGGWVGLPDGYYLLIHPDPGSASKTAPLWVFRAMLEGLARRR